MGDSIEDQRRLKEKFCFSNFNRIALNPGRHIYDENLKFTPSPTTDVTPPELVLARTPAFFVNFTQAGGEPNFSN